MPSAPYGWRTALHPSGKLVRVEDESEQRALRRIAELHAQGVSVRQIALRLEEEGFTPRGARWHRNTVVRLLKRMSSPPTLEPSP